MNYRKEAITFLIILVMALAGLTACNGDDGADASSPGSSRPPTVEAKRGDLTSRVSIPGNISMPHRAGLSFGVNGTVEELNVELGDEVKEGEVVAGLKADSLRRVLAGVQADLRTAEINLAQFHQDASILEAEAAVSSAEASLSAAEIALDQSRQFGISDAETEVESAASELEATRDSGELIIDEAESRLDSAWEGWDEYLLTNTSDLPADELELLGDEEQLWEDIIEAENNLESALPGPGDSIDEAWAEVRAAYDILSGVYPDIPQMRFAVTRARASLAEAINDLVRVRYGYEGGEEVLIPDQEDIDSIAGAKNHLKNARDAWVELVSCHIDNLISEYSLSVQEEELLRGVKTSAVTLQLAQENVDASTGSAEVNLSVAERKLESVPAQIEQKEADVANARANLASSQGNLIHAKGGLNEELLQLAVDKAEIALEEAQGQLDDGVIVAPFDGTVAGVNIDIGDRIMANTIVMQIIDTGKVEIAAVVDEIDVAKLQVGQLARIQVDAFPDASLTGEVTAISPMGRSQSGLITYDVEIALEDLKGYPLKDLMTVTADIEAVLARDVLLVPKAAIHTDRATGNRTVRVITNSGEEKVRPVETGLSDGRLTEITSGLEEGEQVVSSVDIEVTENPEGSAGSGDVDIMECMSKLQDLMPCFEKLMGMAEEFGIDTSEYSGEIPWEEIEQWADDDTGEVPDDVRECLNKLIENRRCIDALIEMAEDMGIDPASFRLEDIGGMMGK